MCEIVLYFDGVEIREAWETCECMCSWFEKSSLVELESQTSHQFQTPDETRSNLAGEIFSSSLFDVSWLLCLNSWH